MGKQRLDSSMVIHAWGGTQKKIKWACKTLPTYNLKPKLRQWGKDHLEGCWIPTAAPVWCWTPGARLAAQANSLPLLSLMLAGKQTLYGLLWWDPSPAASQADRGTAGEVSLSCSQHMLGWSKAITTAWACGNRALHCKVWTWAGAGQGWAASRGDKGMTRLADLDHLGYRVQGHVQRLELQLELLF